MGATKNLYTRSCVALGASVVEMLTRYTLRRNRVGGYDKGLLGLNGFLKFMPWYFRKRCLNSSILIVYCIDSVQSKAHGDQFVKKLQEPNFWT